jgi:hypothetical protein
VDPVPDTLLFRKSDSTGNRTRDLWICNQELCTFYNLYFNLSFYITDGKIKRSRQHIFRKCNLLLIFCECNFYLSLSLRTLLRNWPVIARVISYFYVMTFTYILVTRRGNAEYEYEIEYEIVRNNRACAILLEI